MGSSIGAGSVFVMEIPLEARGNWRMLVVVYTSLYEVINTILMHSCQVVISLFLWLEDQRAVFFPQNLWRLSGHVWAGALMRLIGHAHDCTDEAY